MAGELTGAENGAAAQESGAERDGRSDGGLAALLDRLREQALRGAVAWSLSMLLGVLVVLVMVAAVRPKDWGGFWTAVIAEVVGTLVVALALTPAFLAIRAFVNERFGRTTGFASFPYQEFIRRLDKSGDLVRIMDTYSGVIDDVTDNEREAIERRRCVAALKEVLARPNNVSVEILLLDPTSDAARQRDADLRDQGVDVTAGIGRNLALLNGIRLKLPATVRKRLLVRLYNSTPTCAYYRVDDQASIALYALQTASEQSTHVDVALKSVLGKLVNDHFRLIRESSVDLVDYLYGWARVGNRRERVAWIEQPGPRLYLAVPSAKERSVVYKAQPGAPLMFEAYGRPEAEYTALRSFVAGQDEALARSVRDKYGVGFDVLFEVTPSERASDPAPTAAE